MKNARKILLGLMVAGAMLAACDDKSQTSGGNGGDARQGLIERFTKFVPVPETQAGNFLSSHFAQSQYDWAGATKFLDRVLAEQPDNTDLLKRSMILAVGSGDMGRAAERAQTVLKKEPKNGLALLVLSVEALSKNDMADAEKYLAVMPDGDLTAFVKPLILGWVKAAGGQLETAGFNNTTIHMYHAACMALMLHKEDKAREFARRMIETGSLGVYDAERAGDLLAVLGEREDALTLYKNLLAQEGSNADLSAKIEAVRKNDGSANALMQPLKIKTAEQGAALAMYDMAFVLYSEYSDTSAKIFAQMAKALNPAMVDAQLLLGDILARNGRYDEAIEYFKSVPKDNHAYQASQRHAADLLADAGRRREARDLLNKLYNEDHDLESLIRVGDMYREDEDYGSALKVYNKAADALGGKIPEEYWYLYYARGMAYERQGDWTHAESDLKDAMAYRPDNPYLLNYLAYGWADQGKNLDDSLKLIKRAVQLKPTDGYITDSLGWIYYMLGRYEEAVPHLERAVELLPYDSTINDHLGDAYWRVGRRIEAKYQWQRASANAGPKEDKLKESIAKKLANGLSADDKGTGKLGMR